jgi:hydrogenase/urease accessory protein HupE
VRRFVSLLLFLGALFAARTTTAHGMRIGALKVDEVSSTRALVRWTTTVPNAQIVADLPPDCSAAPVDVDDDPGGQRIWTLDCPGGIAGHVFGVRGLGPVVNEATVFVTFFDGRTVSHLLVPSAPTWEIPRAQSALGIASTYVRLGLVHIATGADHLLFLVLLVLLLRRARAVLLAETAFTVSHSFSFAATSLGWVRVAAAPAEACIALSLVLLALDVREEPRVDARRGAAAAFVFGLVHGLGFAGGLREMGLPDAHAALALVGFGAGVEIGQVAFLVALLGLTFVLARLRAFPRLVTAGATAIGSLATAWLVERLVVALSA